MSHFLCTVIAPKDVNVEEYLQKVLEPYNEGKKVPEYGRPCGCGTWLAYKKANEEVDKKLYSYETLHNNFKFREKEEEEGFCGYMEKRDKAWKEYSKEYFTAVETEASKITVIPMPECSECNGSGFYKSNYNPNSKWDWYVVGGRWDGVFDGKNIVPIRNVECSFAVVDPDGNWHERGEMGWWAVVTDEKENWDANDVINKYIDGDYIIVAVDMHIYDYKHKRWTGATEAVNEFFKVTNYVDTLAVIQL